MTSESIPPDFPHAAPAGAVPGAQPKLLVFEQSGRFVAGTPEISLHGRYLMCEDLARQLVIYYAGKRAENPARSGAQLRNKVAQAIRQRAFGWGLSPAEVNWVLGRFIALAPADKHEDNE